jgi:hypothetical protein
MEEILLQHLGLTKEEFDKGLNDFFISKQSNNSFLKEFSLYHEYVLHLISNYKIENRNKKLNDLGI